jgi:hypothetical protein
MENSGSVHLKKACRKEKDEKETISGPLGQNYGSVPCSSLLSFFVFSSPSESHQLVAYPGLAANLMVECSCWTAEGKTTKHALL